MQRLMRLVVAVVTVAGLAAVPAQGSSPWELHTLPVAANAWAAYQVHLPPDADSDRITVHFTGTMTGSRVEAKAWVLRPPFTTHSDAADTGSLAFFEMSARAGMAPLIGSDVRTDGGHPLGPTSVWASPLSVRLPAGESILVVLFASDRELTGEISLTAPRSDAPPPSVGDVVTGPAHYVTERDLETDEPGVTVSAGAAAAVGSGGSHHATIQGRMFGWGRSGYLLGYYGSWEWRVDGPSQGTSCGQFCTRFNGTPAGTYGFHLDSMMAVGTGAAVDIVYADVLLDSLIS